MRRLPAGPVTSRAASTASAAAGYFAAGSACANEPPTAPRLRICKWPISALALMSRVWQQHTGREPAASRRSAKGIDAPRRRRRHRPPP
jgi:hypothetical protein